MKKKSLKKRNIRNKSKKQRGGSTMIKDPSITYNNSKHDKHKTKPILLLCKNCRNNEFKVETVFLGIFDERFKTFKCSKCGSVEIFSNEIKCSGKDCD